MTTKPVVLITGAAGGMGLATAQHFAAKGWRPLLTDKDEARIAAAAKELNVPFMSGDIASPETCRRIVAWAVQAAGRMDALVNAAGIWREGPAETTTEEDFDAVMAVNVKGLYFMSAAAIPALRKSQGTIINISSDAGLQGNAGAALYCASKGAVTLFTKALALELAPDNINVNAVCPGDVATPMLKFQAARYGGGDEQAYYAKLLAGYPQGARARFIKPEEVAAFIFHLCQPESKPITGAALSIDFGYSAGKF
jgi:NAD(P)-dependent dehydrogenase (short-subunit alcohol dehydrogenase family)